MSVLQVLEWMHSHSALLTDLLLLPDVNSVLYLGFGYYWRSTNEVSENVTANEKKRTNQL